MSSRRTTWTTAAATVIVLAGGLAAAAPASAESGRVTDRAGDAPAYADIRALDVDNRPRRLDATVTLRAFDRERTSAYAIVTPRGNAPGALYLVGWTQGEELGRHAVLVRLTQQNDPVRVRCRGLDIDVSAARDTVAASVPKRCLGRTGDGPVHVVALSEAPDGGDLDDTRALRLAVG